MLNGLYGYLFGSEDVNDNDTKENVAVLTNPAELFAPALPNEISETKDDDWVLLDGEISGRSTPVLVPEPDLIAIDDDLSMTTAGSLRPESSVPDVSPSPSIQKHCYGCVEELQYELYRRRADRAEKFRQARLRALERRELEQKLFEDQVLRPGIEQLEKKQHSNNNKTTNMVNNAAKMKRSTAAGYVATESKTKPRSKKTNRLLAGRNNDRKVNNLN